VLRLVVIVALTLAVIARPVTAQLPQIELLPGTVRLDAGTEASLRSALAADAALLNGSTHIAITNYSCPADACFASVLGFRNPDRQTRLGRWLIDDAVFVGTVLIQSGVSALEGSAAYSRLLRTSALPRQISAQFDPSIRRALSANETLDFPWTPGTTTVYGVLGVHRGGFIEGWQAVDFLSDGNTAINRAPNVLLASAPGVITYVCDDGVSAAVRIGDLIYVHLVMNDGLRVGRAVQRNERLGTLRPGNFRDRCGFAAQQPQNFHVHLAFQRRDTLEMGGWTLTTADQIWRRGDQRVTPGRVIRNDGLTGCNQIDRGDSNCDLTVDGIDYVTWLNTRCDNGCNDLRADFNQDRRVDNADLDIWLKNRRTAPVGISTRAAGDVLDTAEPVETAQTGSLRISMSPTGTVLPGRAAATVTLSIRYTPAISAERVQYGRVVLAVPPGMTVLTSSLFGITPNGIGQVLGASSAAEVASSGVLYVETIATRPTDGLSGTRPITLAVFTIAGTGIGVSDTIRVIDAQWIDNRSTPIRLQTQTTRVRTLPNQHFLPIIRRGPR
jgi:hypothetical protein